MLAVEPTTNSQKCPRGRKT